MIQVEVRGLERVERFLQNLANFASGRTALLRQLGDLVHKQHVRRVVSEKTAPSGGAWAALKPSTVRQKGNANIMIHTGRLAGAFQDHYGGDEFRLTDGAFYLIFHQFGTRKMVQREIMGYSSANLKEIEQAVNAFVAARLGAA